MIGFNPPVSFSTASEPVAIATGSLRANGRSDLVVACQSGVISVLLGDGSGGFAAATNLAAGTRPHSLALGDFNGDGHLDLAVGLSDFHVAVLFGDGSGSFGAPSRFSVAPATGGYIQGAGVVAVADINNDGHLDIVCADHGSGAVSVLIGDGAGGFAAARVIPIISRPSGLVLGDWNHNGHIDFAVTNLGPGLSVYLGDGSGNFAFPNAVLLDGVNALVSGDFNRNGHLDIAAIAVDGVQGGPDTIAVLLGDGAGQFTAPSFFSTGGPSVSPFTPEITSLAVVDLDWDFAAEIVVPKPGLNQLAVLPGDGTGQFAAPIMINTGGDGPVGVVWADFNGNLMPDLAVVNYLSNTVTVLLNSQSPPTGCLPGSRFVRRFRLVSKLRS